MPRKLSSHLLAAIIVTTTLFVAAPAASAQKGDKKKAAAKPAPAKNAAAKSGAKEKRGSERAASRSGAKQKETQGASKREQARAGKAGRRDTKAERADKRKGRDDRRADRAEKNSRKDPRQMSRRERMAEARREAERRRREAAERARQAAIARALALARQRAADQALRDETAANIERDNTTGEDLEVRRVAVQALGNHAGTVVVMNPKTGQVYTVVNQEWGLRRGFKPCSTVKIVTGLAGLSESVIDPVQTVNIGTGTFSLDLTDSLALSNNGYFQRVGGEVGFSKMMDYARKLGFGRPTGVNYPLESPGRLPVYKEGYAVNHMSSHGDDIEVTAMQLANMSSAIANGGKLLVPHLPRTPQEHVNFKRVEKGELDIPKDNLRRVLPGMIGAVNYGTGRRAYDPSQTIAGKTGSCIGQGSWLGLFTSFAPVHDPQLSVTVITRGSGARGKFAAAVAGDIYRQLGSRYGVRRNAAPALANDLLAPRPKVDLRKAAELSDEETGDEEAAKSVDAYVVSEAGAEAQNGPIEGRNAIQKTVKTLPRPVSAPSATVPARSAPEANGAAGSERPRRVTERP